jgi:predicted nucleic acid-binding protein
MKKWIIDTNIICHWLMTNKVLMPLISYFGLSPEFHTVYKNRFNESCDLLTKIQTLKKGEHNFYVDELSYGELFSALRNEIRTIVLFVSGVPLSKWGSEREYDSGKIPEHILRQVVDETLRGVDELFQDGKLEFVETHTPSNDHNFIEVYSSLIFLFPRLQTQDAILLCDAILEKAHYFVTTDSYLLNLNKAIPDRYKLRILKPSTALIELKLYR